MSNEPGMDTVDGQVFVEVDAEEMSAKLTVLPPQEESGRAMTEEDIRKALAAAGVTAGIREQAFADIKPQLDMMAEEKLMAEPVEVVIAQGTVMVPGEDARLELLFKKPAAPAPEAPAAAAPAKPEKPGKAKEEDEDAVDFHAKKEIENVAQGAAIARKIHAKAGVKGLTVKGKELPAPQGKDIPFKAGPGVKVDPKDKDVFLADIGGQVIIKESEISVKSIFEVKGDVDFSTGSIDFVGTVIIQGNVKDDFKIKAGEDLIINGVVEAAEITCGRNLTILGGMMGHDKGSVHCANDATIKYVRNVAKCEVGGNLTCTQAVMYSNVVVKGKLNVTGSKGAIIGGKVIAGQSVLSNTIGNNMATPTDIQVGSLPGIVEEKERVEKALAAKNDELDKSKKGVVFLKNTQAKMGALPPAKKELLAKLTRAQFQLMGEIKTLTQRKTDLDKEIEAQQTQQAGEGKPMAKVSVTGLIYTGVRIKIHEANRAITEELKYCTLTEAEGEVKVGPFSG